MYQDQVIPAMIKICEEFIAAASPAMAQAGRDCLAFWQSVLEARKSTPYDPKNISRVYGSYVVIRVSHNPTIDEWTGVGVMLFDPKGDQIYARVGPFDRAISRLDLKDDGGWIFDNLTSYPKAYTSIEQVKRALDSMGHAMSSVQMTAPRFTIIDEEAKWSLYQTFVLGMRGV